MRRVLALCLLGSLAACGGTPEPAAPPPPAWIPPDATHQARYEGGEGEASLLLRFTGINDRYRSHLTEPDRLAALAKAVAPCVSGGIELVATYDATDSLGRLVLVVPSGRLTCRATATEGGLDVSALTPLSTGLAAYRQGLGATRDMRILSWKAGVLIEGEGVGTSSATLWLAGQYPEDGSTFSPCVDVGGVFRCPEDAERSAGTTTLPLSDPETAKALRRVFPR